MRRGGEGETLAAYQKVAAKAGFSHQSLANN
jgi:hypothetical protein